MEQTADETTLRADSAEERSRRLRGEQKQKEADVGNWRCDATSETQLGGTGRDAQRPEGCDLSPSSLLSLKMYLTSSSSTASSSTDSMSSSQQSNTGVDCAGIVLNCLFCRFYDLILMLRDSCERVANHCCPSYKQVVGPAESSPGSNDGSCMALDCGLLGSCQDAGDCIELAMEVSELCYR